jgi:hypothetical protein
MLKLGGHKEFIDDRRMNYDDLIEFLGLESYSEDYDREDKPIILEALNKLKKNIDAINPKSTCIVLEKNLQKLSRIIELNRDCSKFCVSI